MSHQGPRMLRNSFRKQRNKSESPLAHVYKDTTDTSSLQTVVYCANTFIRVCYSDSRSKHDELEGHRGASKMSYKIGEHTVSFCFNITCAVSPCKQTQIGGVSWLR